MSKKKINVRSDSWNILQLNNYLTNLLYHIFIGPTFLSLRKNGLGSPAKTLIDKVSEFDKVVKLLL